MARLELEAALRRDPDDEDAWSVLGDLLTAEGDTRGELIALEQRAAASERPFERAVLEHQALELFERDHRRWLGPLADAGLGITWQRGFATKVVIGRRHLTALEQLLHHPIAGLLRKLVLVRPRSLATVTKIARLLHEHPVEALELRAPPPGALAELALLEGLRELEIEAGSCVGVEALASLASLRELSLVRCEGPLTGLGAGFRSLRKLDLSARGQTREPPNGLDPLADLPGLQQLVLKDSGWSEIDALAELDELERLDLRSTDITDLTPLAALRRLRSLELGGCTTVANVEPLAGLDTLERLGLAYTRVRDLRPLAGLRALESLELSGSAVADLSPLFGLPALRKVEAEACELATAQPLLDRGVVVSGLRPAPPSWRELAEGLLRTGK
jgi:hypothetical protein